MDPLTIGIIATGILLVVIVAGMPIGYSMTFVGLGALLVIGGPDVVITMAERLPVTAIVSITLAIIPLFILLGEVARAAGVAEDTFNAMTTLGGRVRGKLAMSTIGAAAAFGSVSGSSVATALTIGKPALFEMERRGYQQRLAMGTVAAGGTLGILIPPSITLVIYALITNVSIAEMFIAGVIPGLMLAALFILFIGIRARLNPKLVPEEKPTSFRDKIRSLPMLIPLTVIAVVVLGGVIAGWVSLTEVAALGALVALAVWAIRKIWRKRRGVTLPSEVGLKEALTESVKVSSMIAMILIGSHVFVTMLAFTRVPIQLGQAITELGLTPLAFIIASVILFFILGMFFETMGIMLLTIPFMMSTVGALGIDPIWYGIMFVVVAEMGLITPPVGLNVFVIKGLSSRYKLSEVFKGSAPFLLCNATLLVLIIAFPDIVMWLPNVLGGGAQ